MGKLKFKHVLAFDPGKRHFAFCAVNSSGDILGLGMVTKTVTNLDDMHAIVSRDAFVEQLTHLVTKYTPDIVVIERYQQRPGMGGGAPAEFINVMIGIVLEFCASRNIRVIPVTAATWKAHMKLAYDPKPEKKVKGERIAALPHAHRMGHVFAKDSKTVPIPDHQFDAAGIAMWLLETQHNASHIEDFKEQLDELWEARNERKAREKAEARASKASKPRRKRGAKAAGSDASGVRGAGTKTAGRTSGGTASRVRKSGR